MKSIALLLHVAASTLGAEELTTVQAAAHAGESATVCGIVSEIHTSVRSKGEPIFISMDGRYPNEAFTVLIWGEDEPKFVGLEKLTGSRACASGKISLYRGRPEIVLREPGALHKR